MTMLDAENLFSNYQDITATAASENVIDLLKNRNLAAGDQIFIDVWATTAFAAAGAATLQVQVQQASDEAFSSPEVLIETDDISKDDLAPGAERIRLTTTPRNDLRYLRLNYVVASGPMTAGEIHAGLALDVQDWTANEAVIGA